MSQLCTLTVNFYLILGNVRGRILAPFAGDGGLRLMRVSGAISKFSMGIPLLQKKEVMQSFHEKMHPQRNAARHANFWLFTSLSRSLTSLKFCYLVPSLFSQL